MLITITYSDANLFLGRIMPHHFPSTFGPKEDQPLDTAAAAEAIEAETARTRWLWCLGPAVRCGSCVR